MKNLDLNGLGVQEMNAEEMNGVNGGRFIVDYLIGKAIDGLIWCAAETYKRGTLANMNQVDVKLWN